MEDIRHQAEYRDSLYSDISGNLDIIFGLFQSGQNTLVYSIPILCAAKLEAFINVAGKLKSEHWNILERKLSFEEKCKIITSIVGISFDSKDEPNKTAIAVFEIRNSLVHPKMKIGRIDENISHDEYLQRSASYRGEQHHLRAELTREKVQQLKYSCDAFVNQWGPKLLDGQPEYWLSNSASWSFSSTSQ